MRISRRNVTVWSGKKICHSPKYLQSELSPPSSHKTVSIDPPPGDFTSLTSDTMRVFDFFGGLDGRDLQVHAHTCELVMSARERAYDERARTCTLCEVTTARALDLHE